MRGTLAGSTEKLPGGRTRSRQEASGACEATVSLRFGVRVDDAPTNWLTGVGFGIQFWNTLRLDFGYRLNDVPRSLQLP